MAGSRPGPVSNHVPRVLSPAKVRESITVGGEGPLEIGYMVGWTSRQIPARFRVALWKQRERWELEPWRELLKDKSRELPVT